MCSEGEEGPQNKKYMASGMEKEKKQILPYRLHQNKATDTVE